MKGNVIVTGATSFIGIHLIQELQKEPVTIYAVIRPESKNQKRLEKFPGLHILPCEIREMEKLMDLLPEQIDVFYHLAWDGTRKPYRDDEGIQKVNYQAAIRAYHVAREKGCKKFVGVGSQAEYGKMKGSITEDYPAHPTTQYGKYKLKSCCEIEKMGKNDGITVIWPRIFSVYGKYDYSGAMIMYAIQKMKKDQPLKLTECVQNWNYLYVKDVGRMLCRIAGEACEAGTYNFASRDNRPLRDYVEELKQILGSHSELHFGTVSYGDEGAVSLCPSIGRFERNCPNMSFTSFAKGIRDMSRPD